MGSIFSTVIERERVAEDVLVKFKIASVEEFGFSLFS